MDINLGVVYGYGCLALTTSLLFLISLIIILVFMKVKLRKSKPLPVPDISSKLLPKCEHAICDSLQCIRCSRNQEILQQALTKLSYFSATDQCVKNDVEYLTKDIETSLSLLKNKSKGVDRHKMLLQSSPIVFKMFGLKDKEIWSEDEFPALQILNQHFDEIYLEFKNLYSNIDTDDSVWKVNSTETGRWEIAHLINQGCATRVCDLCPITFQVLKKMPDFLDNIIFGDASFSVVHTCTDISTHCGSTNVRIRCHLGLKVPEEKCYLKVGEHTCHWEEKKFLCFNDAYPHSVHHQGPKDSSIRAVFMFDIWHPDITESQKKIMNYAFSN